MDENWPQLTEDLEQRLELLVRIAEILQIDDVSFLSYSTALTHLSAERLAIRRSLNRLEFAEREIREHLASVQHETRLMERWKHTMETDSTSGESAVALERRREALLKKAKEYHKELETLMAGMSEAPIVTVTDLVKQQESIKEKEQILKAKRAKIKTFQGLPPNLDLARNELRHARSEQMKLIQLRERLLGRMADNVS